MMSKFRKYFYLIQTSTLAFKFEFKILKFIMLNMFFKLKLSYILYKTLYKIVKKYVFCA